MRILSRHKSGQPKAKLEVQNFPVRQFNNPILKRRTIRTLIKAKGPGTPGGFDGRTDAKGVTSSSVGFTSSPRIVKNDKRSPVAFGRGKKVIAPPSKTNGGPIKRRKSGI